MCENTVEPLQFLIPSIPLDAAPPPSSSSIAFLK